eukprot:Sspe_Gene.21958::Locus_8269_Transcript_1_1_Confidence_1.000_Length_1883::g.21958::m.21958
MRAVTGALLALLAVAHAGTIPRRKVSVWVEDGRLSKYEMGTLREGSGWGEFDDGLNHTGWGILDLTTSHTAPDADQAYAAGAVEGLLTAPRIWEHYLNMYDAHFGGRTKEQVEKVKAFMAKQDQWAREQIRANTNDPFWRQVGNIFAQFDGLVAGYNKAADDGVYPVPPLSTWAFQVLNGDGDLFQIIPAVLKEARVDYFALHPTEAEVALQKAGKCSAIIKVTGNYSDLYMGHSAWYVYQATNRIFKHYNIQYRASEVAAKKVSFSSYPGYLESLDDFYMMDSGLGMVQTSINFANSSWYDLIHPESLLAWQRVRTANVMAKTGEEWHKVVSTHYSGTYCNQYMVVNYNLFTPGNPLVPGTLWVMEEIPGQLPGQDVTDLLSYGYWPSYNVPFFKQVYATSRLEELALRGVPSASYQLAPRAKIFRRDEGDVRSFADYHNILRYNEYKTDAYAHGDPCAAICCRGDLRSGNSLMGADGCYDTKVTHYGLFQSLTASIINGPTYGGKDNLPPFKWADAPRTTPHIGLPPVYNFSFITTSPKNL